MNLHQLSVLIFLLLIALLVLLALWPTPGMITFVSGLTVLLVLLQTYLILIDPTREPLSDEDFSQE